jgi:hypothetical protein
MKVTALVEVVSRVLHMPEATVELYARRLRENEQLPQSRGRSHPGVSEEHCSLLVCALLVSDNARRAPETVKCWEPLVDRLAEILRDVDWASQVEGVRVNLHAGEANILDRRAGARQIGYQNFTKGFVPDRSKIGRHAVLPDGVIEGLAKALSEN